MNKEIAYQKTKKYFKGNTLKLMKTQIGNFYKTSSTKNKELNINDEVLLDNNTLIHGTRISIQELINIKNDGLIAPEFIGEYNKNKKKPFVVEFWKIDKEISLKNYLNKYCGVTIEVKDNSGKIIKNIITSLTNVEEEILKLENYRDYTIYQNQEQRFLPNKYNNNSTMAFIIRNDSEEKNTIIKNDIFSLDFNQKILKKILPNWFYKKYMVTRNFDNYETGREKAILYGIPSTFIEGIIVNKEIEKNIEDLKRIKDIFPKCYICNISGKVIM